MFVLLGEGSTKLRDVNVSQPSFTDRNAPEESNLIRALCLKAVLDFHKRAQRFKAFLQDSFSGVHVTCDCSYVFRICFVLIETLITRNHEAPCHGVLDY